MIRAGPPDGVYQCYDGLWYFGTLSAWKEQKKCVDFMSELVVDSGGESSERGADN